MNQLFSNGTLQITEIAEQDQVAYVEHFRDPRIHANTLRLPFPYTMHDAYEWIEIARQINTAQPRPTMFAIREATGKLIGGCGIEAGGDFQQHVRVIGYWMAKAFRGRGFASQAVRWLSGYVFEERSVRKIVANVFAGNEASCRVLEKCGFRREGYLREHYQKEGRTIDAIAFGLCRTEWERRSPQ
ncbi:GNAT family N-acetyltransferase [Planctomycetales bacterium 10988]|nr:GNAT family N-acetyltransferase [Planctomycetales bacterium 10988]